MSNTTDPIVALATDRVRGLTPYLSARRIGGEGHTFLNANEAPKSAAFLISSMNFNRYPECQPPELIDSYARYAGVEPECVMCARGSDEVIGLIIRTFCEPGRESIIICPPTYGMYSVSAVNVGVLVTEIAPLPDYQPDTDAIIKEFNTNPNAKVLFLCSPNNPTGTLLSREKLITILEAVNNRAIVVVDEAYIEFCPQETMVDLLKQYRSLVITRTLSKGFALAGIRCGFALADQEIIKALLKVIDPYPISDPVAQIAEQALSKNGLEIMRDRIDELNERKARFIAEVKALPIVDEVFADHGNFILFRFKEGSELFYRIARKGIILRDFNGKPTLDNCIRITIGSEPEMTELLEFLKSI